MREPFLIQLTGVFTNIDYFHDFVLNNIIFSLM